MLEINTKAPDFALADQHGNIVHLSDFLGKKVVLYFYPKDNTPGCTKEACAFKSMYEAFRSKDIEVIGVSKDSPASHKKFIAKYELPFTLLSDPQTNMLQEYEVWKKKKLAGHEYMGVVRSTYIINEEGRILHAMEKVNPEKNPLEVAEYLNV